MFKGDLKPGNLDFSAHLVLSSLVEKKRARTEPSVPSVLLLGVALGGRGMASVFSKVKVT